MKKKIILRGVLGFPIGIAVGYLITIFSSFVWANGYYSPCTPELISVMGNEINAVMFQTLLCGLLGMVYAGGSVIWEIENWNILKQTGIYFLVICAFMMPIAYFLYWMEHSAAGFLSYFMVFILIFAVTWAVQFMIRKRDVEKMNANLYKWSEDENEN